MSVAQWIVGILLMLSAIVMIVTVLMQSSERTGIGAVSGAAETFFGKNKGRSVEAKLQKVTVNHPHPKNHHTPHHPNN